MNYSTHKITLDVAGSGMKSGIILRRGESAHRLEVSFTDGGKPYTIASDCTAMFAAAKPDNTQILNTCTISGNTVTAEITPQTTAAVGRVDCEIRLYGLGDMLLIAPRFCIFIEDTAIDENGVESSDEYSALDELIGRAQNAISAGLITAAEATVDTSSGTPAVAVTQQSITGGKKLVFAFTGLKGSTGTQGAKGDTGDKGDTGEKGDTGSSGVYVGSGTVPAGYNVQIDPNGSADSLITSTEFEPAAALGAITAKKVDYLTKLTKGQAWGTSNGTTPAYAQTVTTGGKCWAVNRIGGRTITPFNLWDEVWESGSLNNTTGRPATDESRIRSENFIAVVPETTYYACTGDRTIGIRYYSTNSHDDGSFLSSSGSLKDRTFTTPSGCYFIKFTVVNCTEYGNDICINLSQADATVYPHDGDYVPYFNGLLSADVVSVDSVDEDNVSLGTLTIPAALRTAHPLRSAGTYHDEYDIARKKFVQRVGVYSVTGSESITTIEALTDTAVRFWIYANTGVDMATVRGSYNQITCNKLAPSTGYDITEVNTIAHSYNGGEGTYPRSLVIKLPVSVGTTEAALRAWLTTNTPIVYYPLKTPVETDISEYFGDDNLLTVEEGGTVTFTQSGAHIPVPNETVMYAVKEPGAGDIAYSGTETYASGTVGAELTAQKGDIAQQVPRSAQAAKTSAMTQAVGIDANGKLWAEPGGGGGGSGGTYELIEKIINGYAITTSQPADWTTNWTDYFTNTGTLRNPTYTPVTGDIAPTWQSATYYSYSSEDAPVWRNTEPDGTPYAFRAMFVRWTIPANKSVSSRAFSFTLANAATIGNWTANTSVQNYEQCAFARCYPDNGYWMIESTNFVHKTVTYQHPQLLTMIPADTIKYAVASYPTITKFFVKDQYTKEPAGFTVEIWGIR